MELVDNAIDSRVKGSQLEVLLQVHPSYFVIETRGGEGMGRPSSSATIFAGEAHPNAVASCWGTTVRAARRRLVISEPASPFKPADLVMGMRGASPTPITATAPSSQLPLISC
jgi:hypothetical protein